MGDWLEQASQWYEIYFDDLIGHEFEPQSGQTWGE